MSVFAASVGCGGEDESGPRSELVSPPDANIAMALVREGDSLYVARPLSLERIDAVTGVVSELAGPEWAECPLNPSTTWLATADDYAYPNLVVRGTTLYLVDDRCGVWSFDVATKEKRMLVDPSLETKETRTKAEGVFPEGATWNGKTGPDWITPWGMALAADGDGLVACFQAKVFSTAPLRIDERVELWSLSREGTPREMLTSVGLDRSREDGRSYCTHVVPDATSILFSTDDSILRWDRATRAVTTLVSGYRYGPEGLAQDATHVFYVGVENDVRRLARDGGEPLVLRATSHSPSEPPRMRLTVDGEYVYFHEGYSLMRVKKDGSDLIELAAGKQGDWVLPMTLGIAEHHVYFQRMTMSSIVKPNDNGSSTLERTHLGSIYRTAR